MDSASDRLAPSSGGFARFVRSLISASAGESRDRAMANRGQGFGIEWSTGF